MHKIIAITLFVAAATIVCPAKQPDLAPSYAWTIMPPLGLREPSTIDTTLINYAQRSVPSEVVSPAYATTGNYGTEGINMIFFERDPMSDFFFHDVLSPYLPGLKKQRFYNTRQPMTLLSYRTGGGREQAQDRLKMDFSGNINSRAQVGAMFDYIYSKGSYNNQALKNMTWGVSGSYIGPRYEMQAFFSHFNSLNKESGGITDDLYITDPAEIQGGNTSVDTKSIPTNLTNAHSRVRGGQLYINNRYKVGHWHTEYVNDSTTEETYIPVMSFAWTLDYKTGYHMFRDDAQQDESFWDNTYLTKGKTLDETTYWSLRNTVGVSLIEGFTKYAKAGLAAYATHEIRRYNQTADTIARTDDNGLTPYPLEAPVAPKATENLLWVGAQLTKQTGQLLRYEATGEIGLIGPATGDIKADGKIDTRIRLLGDTVTVSAYGRFANTEAPYLMKHYLSNHFIWENDFGKTRSLRFGGQLTIPHTLTDINVGVENIQNHIYFNENSMPVQHGGSVQIFSATLRQNLRLGILNWDNRITYQTSSDQSVIPLPKLTIYSNLYLRFKVARVLSVQFGIDCDYYTRYRALGYQPATMSFINQKEIMVGNYPFCNAYINMRLSRARFYLLFSHVNQGLFGGSNYFSAAHYPLNPRRFMMGVSIDFAN